MAMKRLIPLHGKNYIEILGKDTKKFLQGLVTNDMNHLSATQQPILATGLLNPKVEEDGSFLFNHLL
jgi:folate-binding Fe-S cluster repair protein YgfZ